MVSASNPSTLEAVVEGSDCQGKSELERPFAKQNKLL